MSTIVAVLIYLVPLAYAAALLYVLILATRLVKAVERIADKMSAPNQ